MNSGLCLPIRTLQWVMYFMASLLIWFAILFYVAKVPQSPLVCLVHVPALPVGVWLAVGD